LRREILFPYLYVRNIPADLQDSIEKLEKEVAAREERIQRLKKDLGITD